MGRGATPAASPDRPEATLHVRLLGGMALRLDDTPVGPLGSARAESLLAYLLLHRDAPQPRQRLAFLLWPDSTESQARTNLRHVLHTLRRELPDAERFLDIRPRTLQWRPEAPLWLDVATFEEAVAAGRLAEAVEAYTGALLEGSYDEWVLAERERLAELHRDALERLARELEAQRRWTQAIRVTERIVRDDPLQEPAYQRLIRVHDAAGDRAAAVRVYHRCAATLQRELGVEPAAETRRAYEALLASVSELPATRRGPASPASPPPLVGRAAERAHLTALWTAAETGRVQLALVTGEAGVGKTRLVEELRSWCAHVGALTAEARAYPTEGAMAHGVAVAWLRAEAIRARLPRLPRPHLTELSRLLPELLAEVPGLPAAQPLPASQQRQRLFEAVAHALLGTGAPLLLVAEDLQWCDVQSLQLVHYLLRTAPDARLLVAATVRLEDVDDRHPARQLIAALDALGRLAEIPLERLTREETTQLAEHLTGDRLADGDAARLYAESEGNPLFVVEAVSGGPEASRAASAAGPRSRVRAVIGSRLAQLSEPAAELLGVAATIGRAFTTEVLTAASGFDDPAVVRGLDELWRRGLVRALGPAAYDFSHGKIREAAYEALSPAQTRHHHLRVAQALERDGGDADATSAQIATHYDRAGAASDAVAWYARAAEAAQRLHADADAVGFLERALALTRALPAGTDRERRELELLTALPAPLIAVEGYLSERVAEAHDRALALADRLGVEIAPPLIRSLAVAHLTRGDFEAARPFGEQLQALAERDDDDVLAVESGYVLGIAAFWQGRLDAARAHFASAVARYRPEQGAIHVLRYGQDPRVFCLMRLAYTLWLLGSDEDADRTRDAALALAERSAHPYTRAAVHIWAGLLAVDRRDDARLRHHLRAMTAGDLAHGPAQIRLLADALGGLLDVRDGRTAEGIARVREAVTAARRRPPAAPGANAALARLLVEACAVAGETGSGLAAADQALGMGEGIQLWEAEIRRVRARLLAASGAAPERVAAELAAAVRVARRQGARALQRRALATRRDLRRGTPSRNAGGTPRASPSPPTRPST